MSGSLNKVMLIGRLGRDPELRYTQSNTPVTNLSLATNRVWTDRNDERQEETEWHRIVIFGKMAEVIERNLSTGRQVFVEGRLQTRQWEDNEGRDRYTTEVVASNVQFLGSADDAARPPGGGGQSSPRGSQSSQGGGADFEQSFDDDDIPF